MLTPMTDDELDVSNLDVISGTFSDIPSSNWSLDALLNDAHVCTHTHACNPPGPDGSHTHTCFHEHTKLVPPPAAAQDYDVASDGTAESTEGKPMKCSLGNKVASRKYREKKKAEAASLEDEVVRLRALNQHLLKRLRNQAALEAENMKLKCLLVDVRGRIEGEIGCFPYQRSFNPANAGAYIMNPCNLQCNDQVNCLQPVMRGKVPEGTMLGGQGWNGRECENIHCAAFPTQGQKVHYGRGAGNLNYSTRKRRKGATQNTGST